MRRREFIALISGATAWPFAASAQQQPKLPSIGLLSPNTETIQRPWTTAFVQRLGERGWIEGRTVSIEYRWAEGRNERYAELAAEFVSLNVNVIVTSGTGAVLAAKQTTSVIPIVFATAGDPVSTGIVASLARPGGNVTGSSIQSADLAGKRLEILREVLPGLHQLAILANIANPIGALEVSEVQAAGRTLGLEIDTLGIRRSEDVAPAFAALKSGTGALYVVAEPLTSSNRTQIASLALAARLPTIHGNAGNVEAGGLISYAPDFPDLWRRAADYVDKILRGVQPREIPVEQPTKFELVVNLKSAKALGVTIPGTVLARADEVIE